MQLLNALSRKTGEGLRYTQRDGDDDSRYVTQPTITTPIRVLPIATPTNYLHRAP